MQKRSIVWLGLMVAASVISISCGKEEDGRVGSESGNEAGAAGQSSSSGEGGGATESATGTEASSSGGSASGGATAGGCEYDPETSVVAPTEVSAESPEQLPDLRGPTLPIADPTPLDGSTSTGDEVVLALRTDSSGNIYVLTATSTESTVRRIDTALNTVWRIDQLNEDGGLALRDVAISEDGQVVGIGDSGVVKLSADDGETIWTDSTVSGQAIVAGPNGSTIGLSRYPLKSFFGHDSDGLLVLQNPDTLPGAPLTASFDDEGNYYISYGGDFSYYSYVVKYDVAGSEIWKISGGEFPESLWYGIWVASAPGVPGVFFRSRSYGGAIGAMAETGELLWYREFGKLNPSSCVMLALCDCWRGYFIQDIISGTLVEVAMNTGYFSPMIATADALYVGGIYYSALGSGPAATGASYTNFIAEYDFSGNVQWFTRLDVIQDAEALTRQGNYGINSGFMAELPDDQLVVVERALDTASHGGWIVVILSTVDGHVVASGIPS